MVLKTIHVNHLRPWSVLAGGSEPGGAHHPPEPTSPHGHSLAYVCYSRIHIYRYNMYVDYYILLCKYEPSKRSKHKICREQGVPKLKQLLHDDEGQENKKESWGKQQGGFDLVKAVLNVSPGPSNISRKWKETHPSGTGFTGRGKMGRSHDPESSRLGQTGRLSKRHGQSSE